MEDGVLLQLENVDICRDENVILHQASLSLHQGEFVYVIGKVGSGKSSLLKSLYCEIPICGGEARLLNYNLRKIKRKDVPYLRRKLGIVFIWSLFCGRRDGAATRISETGLKKCSSKLVCRTKGTKCRMSFRVESNNVS